MKLYALPIESACNGSCKFCITKFREQAAQEVLDLRILEKTMEKLDVDKIEITGGGEPTLHPEIDKIIVACSEKAKTQLYTHGANLRGIKNLSKLESLCISRAHYDDKINWQIMGVEYKLSAGLEHRVPIKFSLLLHQSGIHTPEEVIRYLEWASGKAKKVVIRQLFEHEYKGALTTEHISSEEVFNNLRIKDYKKTEQGNPIFNFNGLECEIEIRSCACETHNPVLHANGKVYKGWSNELHDLNRT
ncbi:radical SAM protein [Candidatus Woesearchaeota archaeon]|nr:radical SAM protein [Candidatus Woesearchaeota archaeon]